MTDYPPQHRQELPPPSDRAAVVEGSGRTVEEAIERGLASAGLERTDAEIEVVDEGSRGVLGLGAREARVRIRRRSRADSAALVGALAEDLVRLMGFDAEITTVGAGEGVQVRVKGENLAALIGKHGQTLTAMEAVTALLAGKRVGSPVRVEMDVMGYRERRRAALEELAQRTAVRVARTRREVALAPMDARDRRIIHITLQEHPDVTTASRGEGDLRRVVVTPKGAPGPAAEGAEQPEQRSQKWRQSHGEGTNHRSEARGSLAGRPRERSQNSSGKRQPGARPGRFQDRSGPPYAPGRGSARKPSGAPSGTGSRPEGLPVDEELEAEIQAHLDRVERERGSNQPPNETPVDPPNPGESTGSGTEPPGEG